MMDMIWLRTCATAGEFLYGFYTVPILKKLYEKKKGCTSSIDQLIVAMKELAESGEILMEYLPGKLDDDDDDCGFFDPLGCEDTELEAVMKLADEDGNPYASLHIDEEERLDLITDIPDGLDYYIPSAAEITQLVEEGYIRSAAMDKLENEIRKRDGDPAFLKKLWGKVSTDKLEPIDTIKTVINGLPESVGSLEEFNEFTLYVNDFMNNVNLRARRGWRPHELFKKTHPNGLKKLPTIMPGSVHAAQKLKAAETQLKDMGATVDFSSIDSFVTVGPYGERRVIKVGRNDPCPCGSGKKYKFCHGR